MGSNSETQRLKENSKPRAGGEDRISRLPDAVLCHILSLIPTKYAVRSSIVSNRWKNIWASVPNLDFEDRSNTRDGFILMVVSREKSTDFFSAREICS